MSGRAFAITIISIGFLSDQVVVNDASGLRFYKANQFVNLVRSESTYPAIVDTGYRSDCYYLLCTLH